ncbi:hypothetical protein BH10PLA1_BH10PLA1_03720 [soil metagenome]
MLIVVNRQPIIILGMHRSGTTMVTELLDQLGLFVGTQVQGDHEATYFLSLNDKLLRRVNAAWDNPAPFRAFLASADAVEITTRCLRAEMLSSRIRQFLGLGTYLKYRSIEKFDKPWGWKDPRTVFTLPLWLKLFPEAKIVNVIRHGVDVASSLRVREQKALAARLKDVDRRLGRRSSKSKLDLAAYRGSARCLELAGGFALWEEHVAEAEKNLWDISNPVLTVRFEDFLADPEKQLTELASFCELHPSAEQISAAVPAIDASRGNAWKKDPAMRLFCESVHETRWMRKYGYAHSTSTAPQFRAIG